MSNTPHVRAVLTNAALNHVPPLIRESLLDGSDFRQEYNLRTQVVLSIGDCDCTINRSELYNAIRKTLKGTSNSVVTDARGQEWKLTNEAEIREPPKLVFTSNKQRFILPDYTVLSPDSALRLRCFNDSALDLNLPASLRDRWRDILKERAFEDDEVDTLHGEFRDTPVHWARSIRTTFLSGQISVSSLVPSSRRYFERLVGTYEGSASIQSYAAESGSQFLKRLSAWRPYEGFLFSLFLSSHSALTNEFGVEHIERHELCHAFELIERCGDVVSRLGAIEVGLRILPDNPEIRPSITSLIKQIRDDDIDGSSSEFKVFSALFVLVDGELSRTRLLSTTSPFYRRLASLSHAALIHRQFVNSGIEYDNFCNWAMEKRGGQFYMQSFSDMRITPRWYPSFETALQLKANYFGRVINAASTLEENISGSELHSLILGTDRASLYSLSHINFPLPCLPGPLEGNENSPIRLPSVLSDTIEAQLNTDNVAPSNFYALINSAMIFHVDTDQAQLAAEALRLSKYRLVNVKDKSQLLSTLFGLATVAATTRNPVLAEELRILARRYRLDVQYRFSTEDEIFVCLAAAASHVNLTDWTGFVGDWLTELAFGELESHDGKVLRILLQSLCHAVPDIWSSCGKADAALMAFNNI